MAGPIVKKIDDHLRAPSATVRADGEGGRGQSPHVVSDSSVPVGQSEIMRYESIKEEQ
jgi:hypothetical protein